MFFAKKFKFSSFKLLIFNIRATIYVLLLIKTAEIKTVMRVLRIVRYEQVEWLKIEVYTGAYTGLDLICGKPLFGWNGMERKIVKRV